MTRQMPENTLRQTVHVHIASDTRQFSCVNGGQNDVLYDGMYFPAFCGTKHNFRWSDAQEFLYLNASRLLSYIIQ